MWPCHDNAAQSTRQPRFDRHSSRRCHSQVSGSPWADPTWSAATKAALPPMLCAMAWACGTTQMHVVIVLQCETTEILNVTVRVS